MANEYRDADLDGLLAQDKLVVLDLWAPWCGPCKLVGPIVDSLAAEFEGEALVGKVNVDENPAITAKYGIRNIPTILFIRNGEVVDKHVGNATREQLVNLIKK